MNGALILAAGFSRRFGGDKRAHLITTADGSRVPMLIATARLYASEFSSTTVVLRNEDEVLRAELEAELPQLQTVIAADSHLGMGHSLAAGITAVRHWQYAFVALADMPFIRPATLQLLHQHMESAVTRHQDGTIVQPWCQGRPGHPVGFSSQFFPALAQLQGDEGAKVVVQKAGQRLQRINVTDDGVLLDIDRPA